MLVKLQKKKKKKTNEEMFSRPNESELLETPDTLFDTCCRHFGAFDADEH